MCFSQPKVEVPAVAKPPSRADQSKNASQSVRRKAADQTGVLGNIFSSALGDASYGTNAVKQAKLGTAS